MIVIKVELHSAITGKITALAKMYISNDDTGTKDIGHYNGQILRAPAFKSVQREGKVRDYRRNQLTIWYLVARMLKNMGYLS